MALFRSDRITQASGSIGGTTFSHNRFGLYFRARRTPVNPNTAFQQSQRDALATASAGWRAITLAQRAAWEAYAAGTPVTKKLGETCTLAGAGQFTASNGLGLRLGLALIEDAPTTPGRQALGTPAIVLDASASTAAVTAFDAGAEGATVGLFLGDPQSAGVNFFAGPYQLRGTGDVTTGAITYTVVSGRNSLPLVAGQRIPYRLAGIMLDGRLTTIASGIATVVA